METNRKSILPAFLRRDNLEPELRDLQLQVARQKAELASLTLKLTEAQRVAREATAALQTERAKVKPAPVATDATLRARLAATETERARLAGEVTRLGATVSRQQQDIEKVRAVAIRHGAAAYELPADSILTQWRFDGRTAGQEKQRQAAAAEQAATAARQAQYEAERVERLRESERYRQERAARGDK